MKGIYYLHILYIIIIIHILIESSDWSELFDYKLI